MVRLLCPAPLAGDSTGSTAVCQSGATGFTARLAILFASGGRQPRRVRGLVRCLTADRAQVRYAACVAARAFMLAAGDGRADFYPALLPPLCFNRHDVAEGVRGYSLETWRLVLGGEGPAWVARCLPQARRPHSRFSINECQCTGARDEHLVKAGMGRWQRDAGWAPEARLRAAGLPCGARGRMARLWRHPLPFSHAPLSRLLRRMSRSAMRGRAGAAVLRAHQKPTSSPQRPRRCWTTTRAARAPTTTPCARPRARASASSQTRWRTMQWRRPCRACCARSSPACATTAGRFARAPLWGKLRASPQSGALRHVQAYDGHAMQRQAPRQCLLEYAGCCHSTTHQFLLLQKCNAKRCSGSGAPCATSARQARRIAHAPTAPQSGSPARPGAQRGRARGGPLRSSVPGRGGALAPGAVAAAARPAGRERAVGARGRRSGARGRRACLGARPARPAAAGAAVRAAAPPAAAPLPVLPPADV